MLIFLLLEFKNCVCILVFARHTVFVIFVAYYVVPTIKFDVLQCEDNGSIEILGMPCFQKSAVFLNIVQKAFDPPPLLFEHLSYFAGGVF